MKGLAHQLEDTQQRLDTYVATPLSPTYPNAAELVPFCSMFRFASHPPQLAAHPTLLPDF
jgi:hypothetical protein